MPIQKTKDTILKDLDDLLTNPLKNMGIVTLPGDSKRIIADFLSTALDEIARAGYREGVEAAKGATLDIIEQYEVNNEPLCEQNVLLHVIKKKIAALNELTDKS